MTTPALRIAVAVAEQLGRIDPVTLASRHAWADAVTAALAVADEDAVVAEVVGGGGLAGAVSPIGVVIARMRAVPDLVTERARLADEAHEAARWRAVDRAARRGETLRALVDRGDLFADEAVGMLVREVPDEELRGFAMAALEREMP